MSTPMIPTHPRWREFCDRLEGPEGCNFREREDGEIVWNCASHETVEPAFSKSEKILAEMGLSPDEINLSLNYFREHGGHCDCEVLFNCDKKTKEVAVPA